MVLATALATLVLAQKADFTVPPLATFDGVRWGGLVLGETTDGDLKKRFHTSKAESRPEALAIRTNEADIEVEVLLDGRGDKARASGILVKIKRPISFSDLASHLGGSEPRYLRDRWEDWRLAAFAERGIAALVMSEATVPALLLCAPERLPSALRGFTGEQTAVVRQPDPGERWDRVVLFGRVTLDMDIRSKNRPATIAVRDLQRIEEDATYDARRARGKGNISYERGEDGAYSLTIRSGEWDSKGKASISVTANFRGNTPYGEVVASGFATESVDSDYRNRIYRVIEKAMDFLDQDVSNKVRKLGPPPLESQRREAWRSVLAVGAPYRS